MPYFVDQDQDRDQDPQQGVTISGASPTTENTGESGGTPVQAKSLSTGSGFQNLDKYLKTNQSQQFGQNVLGKVGNEVSNASQQMSQANDNFKNQVTAANSIPDQYQVNNAIQGASASPRSNSGQVTTQPARSAPMQLDMNPTNPKEFQNWMNQSYQGPKSLAEDTDSWNQYWSGANKADAQAKQLGSEAGRFSLLDQYFGKPSYNFGEKSLDNLLVQQSGLGRQTRDLQNQATQLKGQGVDDAKKLQDFASQRAGQVEQSRNTTRSAIGLDANGQVIRGDGAGAIGQSYQEAESDLAGKNAARKAQVDQLGQGLKNGSLTQEELGLLGLSSGQNIYDLDLTKYLTPGSELNLNQTLSPEQRAKITALSQLAGINDTFASGTPQNSNPAYEFQKDMFQNEVSSRQSAAQNALKNSVSINIGGKPLSYTLEQLVNMKNNADRQLANYQPGSIEYNTGTDWYKHYGSQTTAAINQYNNQYGIGRQLQTR